MDKAQTAGKTRSLPLDFLRGVAIFLVLGYHGVGLVADAGYCRLLANFFEHVGWTGVDLFFTLSGFLIGGLLFREIGRSGELQVKRFIIRRGLKIWPLYYLYLAYLVVYPLLHSHTPISTTLHKLIPNLLHIQDYVYMTHEHTWTLAVEEHFYLMLPALLWWLNRRKRMDLIPQLFCIIAVTCLALRLWTVYLHPWTPDGGLPWGWKVFTPTHLRIDALMFGVALAYYYQFRPEVFARLRQSASARWVLFAVGIGLISPAYWLPRTGAHAALGLGFGLTLVYLGCGCILMACVHTETEPGSPGKFFGSWLGRGVAFVGFYSYSIYLWHIDEPLRRVVHLVYDGHLNRFPPDTRWLIAISLFMGLAVLIGMVVSRLVEMPVLASREKFFPDASKAVA